MTLTDTYTWLMEEVADPRVKGWLFMDSALWPVALCTAYLFIVLFAGPRFMKNRAPYKLDTFIIYYNVYQVLSCCIIVYGVATSGWTTTYSWSCQPVDYSNNPEPLRMLSFMWWTLLLKLSEFTETIVFVLRKKDRQVSFLHVYHHVSTFLLVWVGTKFVGGGMATFAIMPNSIVHIVMYTYYLVSLNKSPKVQRVLSTIKPYITIMQMVQFCIIIAHAMQALHPSCIVPKQLAYVYIPNVFLIFYLFYDFYQSNYKQAPNVAKKSKAAKAS